MSLLISQIQSRRILLAKIICVICERINFSLRTFLRQESAMKRTAHRLTQLSCGIGGM